MVIHLLQEMILLENVYHYIKMDYSIYKQFEQNDKAAIRPTLKQVDF